MISTRAFNTINTFCSIHIILYITIYDYKMLCITIGYKIEFYNQWHHAIAYMCIMFCVTQLLNSHFSPIIKLNLLTSTCATGIPKFINKMSYMISYIAISSVWKNWIVFFFFLRYNIFKLKLKWKWNWN